MYPPPYNQSYTATALDSRVSTVMKQVYVKMFLGLLLTAAVSLGIALAGHGFLVYLFTHRWVYWGLMLIELGMVIAISHAVNRLSSTTASLLFYLFSIVNGAALSMVVAVYTPASLFKTFLVCAGTFGAMSIYGYFTKSDLSRAGSYLRMALFGLIIAIVVNIFWANSTLDWIISLLGVAIFVGLTAYDTKQIRMLAEQMPSAADGRIATLGALTLYLDFINLFLYLLRFLGSQRD